MATYYTPITTGAAANASTINSPLDELDSAIGDINANSWVTGARIAAGAVTFAKHDTTELLKEWTRGRQFRFTGTITYNTTYPWLVSTATGTWPDGSAGTFTATTTNSTWRAIDAFTITHTNSGKTVTQSAVTRDTQGRVTTLPALTVS